MAAKDKTTGMKSAYELALERMEKQGIERPREETFSDEAGSWSIDFPDGNPRNAHAGLDGRYLNVERQDGPDAQVTGIAQPGNPLDIVFTDTNSQPSERS